jgi:hypothetical protein
MNGRIRTFPLTLAFVVLAACRSPLVDDGTLATMKRIQENRLTAECVAVHGMGVTPRNTTSLEWGYQKMAVLQACHQAADARVW